jgi:hypothetical protein
MAPLMERLGLEVDKMDPVEIEKIRQSLANATSYTALDSALGSVDDLLVGQKNLVK